jgi:lipopolysaccharide export system protein LptC
VRVLRILLPAGAASAIAVLVLLARFSLPGELDLTAARISVTPNGIVMSGPHISGFDGEHREYTVAAERAVQTLARPDEVRLEAIRATVTSAGQGTSTVTAEAGEYDHGGGTLALQGAIAIATGDGYGLTLRDVDIDFRRSSIDTAEPVVIRYDDSETRGDRMTVREGGRIVVLEGNVRTTLLPPKLPAEIPAAGTE